MVLALLAGRKTQTRRIIKFKRPLWGHHYLQPMWGRSPPPDPVDFGTPGLFREVGPDYPDSEDDDLMSPYVPGHRLWGRETWAPHDETCLRNKERDYVYYRADDLRRYDTDGRWRPSIFMPRWASRLLHEITNVRAEQLRDISFADALAEGIEARGPGFWSWPGGEPFTDPREAYRELWESINGPESWKANPWVWAISFKEAA